MIFILTAPFTALWLWGCSCQLEEDQIGGKAYDRETAENRITFLIDRGECTGRQSFPALSDYPNCSSVLGSYRLCIKNQALVLLDYPFKWVRISFFSILLTLFISSVKYLKTDSGILWHLCRWHTCKLTLSHEGKVLSENLAEKNACTKF